MSQVDRGERGGEDCMKCKRGQREEGVVRVAEGVKDWGVGGTEPRT